MEDIDSPPALPTARKRPAPEDESPPKKPLNLTGTQFMMPTPPDTDQSSNASPKYDSSNTRQGSPAPSSSALSSVEDVSSNPVTQATNSTDNASGTQTASSSGQPPAKKRKKLTPAEKLEQQREREAKAAEKAELKAKKDEEKAEQKAKKDEDKRIKDEEKRKKAEEREAKKREKELEEERKAQEKLKKERSQMRLGAWFQKPATPIKDPVDGEDASNSGHARRRSLSLEAYDAVAGQIRASQSPCKKSEPQKSMLQTSESAAPTPAKSVVSDYNKYFLPFQLKSHCYMPSRSSLEDPEAAQAAFDYCVNDPSLREKYDLGIVDSYATLEQHFAKERQVLRGRVAPNMRQLADQVQGTLQQPIDLTAETTSQNPMDALQAVPRRYLEFSEDVRPAYFGTYTKISSPRKTRRLSRNPFSRQRVDTDYDYDSEAEWEEPEEGEEILDEEEDEAESVGDAHEMDEFLDDEDDATKRKMITGDLVPTTTGLCWENESGKIMPSIEGGSPTQFMRDMRIGVLLPNFSGSSIDPFSTAYWELEPTPAPAATSSLATPAYTFVAGNGPMAPPRQPLQPRAANNNTLDSMLVGAAEGMKGPINSVAALQSGKPGRKPAPKTLSKEDMDEFKEAVSGSQVGKAELLKGLKLRFPKLTNETIKTTLGDHFAQVGANKADKKWVFVGDA